MQCLASAHFEIQRSNVHTHTLTNLYILYLYGSANHCQLLYSIQWFYTKYNIFIGVIATAPYIIMHGVLYGGACFEHSYFVLKFYFHDVCSLHDHFSICMKEKQLHFQPIKMKTVKVWLFFYVNWSDERDFNSPQSICRVSYILWMYE